MDVNTVTGNGVNLAGSLIALTKLYRSEQFQFPVPTLSSIQFCFRFALLIGSVCSVGTVYCARAHDTPLLVVAAQRGNVVWVAITPLPTL